MASWSLPLGNTRAALPEQPQPRRGRLPPPEALQRGRGQLLPAPLPLLRLVRLGCQH